MFHVLKPITFIYVTIIKCVFSKSIFFHFRIYSSNVFTIFIFNDHFFVLKYIGKKNKRKFFCCHKIWLRPFFQLTRCFLSILYAVIILLSEIRYWTAFFTWRTGNIYHLILICITNSRLYYLNLINT